MAALSPNDCTEIGAKFQSDVSRVAGAQFAALTKADIQAAVVAIDEWVTANAVAFNNALPQPARGQLTAAQKSNLLSRVTTRRYETGTV